jgi:hypothetical protein
MMVSSYLDLLSNDLITKIFEMLTMAIEKEIVAAEITLDDIDDRVCGNDITDKWLLGLDIVKKRNPRKIRIMVDNKEYAVPYDVYSITYGHIKYNIADPHLDSNAHLFSRYPLDNVIIILKQDTGGAMIDLETGEFECVILQSPALKSPLYLDILRETSKLYLELSTVRDYYGDVNILTHTFHINNKKMASRYDSCCYKYYDITDEDFAKYNYITTNVFE